MAWPKDSYPLPLIDHLVDKCSNSLMFSFMDAHFGYNQISMAEEDEEKTSFIMHEGTFCYTRMPFGLKNVGVAFQRIMDEVFKKKNGRNVEVYVEDI